MSPSWQPEDAALQLWVDASLSSSFDHVLAEAIPTELLALASVMPDPG